VILPSRREAREEFLGALSAHVKEAGVGHVSEIADADAPHAPRGCPWQAWSVGELLRLECDVLAEPSTSVAPRRIATARRAEQPLELATV
jgi:glycogen debranching enzyme